MKKIILILVAINCINYNAVSQENKDSNEDKENRTDLRKRLLVGLKFGANYSNVYDAKGDNFQADSKLGLAAGAFLAIPIGKYIGVQPEVLYSQKGFHATGMLFGSNYDFTRTTSYLDVPLLFSLKPVKFLSLLAGPQYSYLLKQRDVFINSNSSIAQETEFKNDNIRKNTLCFLGGADITVKHVVVSARAGWDLQQNNGDGSSLVPRYKNVWYQATIGFRLY